MESSYQEMAVDREDDRMVLSRGARPTEGDVLEMRFDRKKGVLEWRLNDQKILSKTLEEILVGDRFYPYVVLEGEGDSVSIIVDPL